MNSLPLRYAVVTSIRFGFASTFVELATRHAGSDAHLVAVVYCRAAPGSPAARRRMLLRRLRKAWAIGVVGTLNGFRMRRWYNAAVAEKLGVRDILAVCRDAAVPVLEIPWFGDAAGQAQFRALDLDLAVSMGNSYIPSSFFTIPRLGMINTHHELLPEYRGAQTALWPLHDGSNVSGYTIHEINRHIDGGRILCREEIPLELRPTLRQTVVESTARIQRRSIDGLLALLANYPAALAEAKQNVGGRTYTTPDTKALLRILRNLRRMRRNAGAHG